jgi:hypothetical protein
MKKALLTIFLTFLFVLPVFGDEDKYDPKLEVDYPGIEEAADATEQVGIYVSFLFNFLVMIVGLILFGALIYAGFVFMTSAGNPEKRSSAIKKIIAALTGVILLLGFYVLIKEINPDFLEVSLEEPEEIEYPPLPAGPYICNFDFPGISGILSNYEGSDVGARNDAIKLFYETLKKQDSGKYCMEIRTPRNTDVGLLTGSTGTYFVIPELEGGSSYNYGIILFAEEDGLRKSKIMGLGVRCFVSLGEEASMKIDTDFEIKSIAPIRLQSEESGLVMFYEGYNFNAEDDPKNNEYTGTALKEYSASIAPGSNNSIISKSTLESVFICGMMKSIGGGWGKKYHCGVRSLAIEGTAPIFVIFKTDDGSFERCNITDKNRENLSTLLPGSIIKGNDDLEGLTHAFKFNEVLLIKGYLMDSER